jgi:thiosulfate reductase cytochrome b subunit
VRLWHWATAIVFVILILTGVVLTYSSAEYALIDYELADMLHQVVGIVFAILFGLFFVAVGVSGYWRRYTNRWQGLGSRVYRHGSAVVSGVPPTAARRYRMQSRLDLSRGFLVLVQQFLYILSIAILSPLLIITGIVLFFPELAPDKVAGLAGLWTFALAHYWAGLGGALFLLFHVYIATIAGFRRLIRGR